MYILPPYRGKNTFFQRPISPLKPVYLTFLTSIRTYVVDHEISFYCLYMPGVFYVFLYGNHARFKNI
ncbi:hypothetical protein SAMN04487930_10548 [Cytophaga hutchinsonii ATCC 33406]|nr:hypothetical protein SAMN04487930_10548 [Cytophaga hutchinsonii ATCC 33406]